MRAFFRRLHAVVSLFLAGGCACLVACGAGDDAAGTPRQPPRLAFATTARDFGRIPQGTKVTEAFHFTNDGDLGLDIIHLRSTNDCTATLLGPRAVPGKGAGTVQVEIETDAVFGPQRRTVTVYSNDPERPATVLELAGEVALDVAVDPPRMYVGAVRRGMRIEREVDIPTGSEAVRVESIVTDAPQLKVLPLDRGAGQHGKRFAIQIRPGAPLGPFTKSVRVHTSSARHPILEVPITGAVEADVSVSPPRLDFGAVPPHGKNVRQLLIYNEGEAPVRIVDADWVPPFGTLELETLRKGFRYRLRATLNDGLDVGEIAGTLRLRTDHSQQPIVEVPVAGHVTEGARDSGREGRESGIGETNG